MSEIPGTGRPREEPSAEFHVLAADFHRMVTFNEGHHTLQRRIDIPVVIADHGEPQRTDLPLIMAIQFGNGHVKPVPNPVFQSPEDHPLALQGPGLSDEKVHVKNADMRRCVIHHCVKKPSKAGTIVLWNRLGRKLFFQTLQSFSGVPGRPF